MSQNRASYQKGFHPKTRTCVFNMVSFEHANHQNDPPVSSPAGPAPCDQISEGGGKKGAAGRPQGSNPGLPDAATSERLAPPAAGPAASAERPRRARAVLRCAQHRRLRCGAPSRGPPRGPAGPVGQGEYKLCCSCCCRTEVCGLKRGMQSSGV